MCCTIGRGAGQKRAHECARSIAVDAIGHALSLRGIEAPFRTARAGILGRVRLLTYDAPVDPVEAARSLSGRPGVLWAEPDRLRHADVVPSDQSFSIQWNMRKVDAPEAWDIGTGNPGVVIAVIDTGVLISHPDLQANVWTNSSESFGVPGVDDDGNGFVDDVHGYDFYAGDGDPMDEHGHGTHVSGTIAGVGNDGQGTAGVNWTSSIMALRFLGPEGSGSTAVGSGIPVRIGTRPATVAITWSVRYTE